MVKQTAILTHIKLCKSLISKKANNWAIIKSLTGFVTIYAQVLMISTSPSDVRNDRTKLGLYQPNRQFFFSNSAKETADRRLQSIFGVNSFVAACMWNHLLTKISASWQPVHLLLALFSSKTHSTKNLNSYICNCPEKTFRKWYSYFLRKCFTRCVCKNFQTLFLLCKYLLQCSDKCLYQIV